MLLEHLDRTQWTFTDARAHVERVVTAYRADEASREPLEPERAYPPWYQPVPDHVRWEKEAMDQLLVALRDGDLHTQGRLSTTRNLVSWDSRHQWQLHSGHHEPISPAAWREGTFFDGRLTSHRWEYIDIRMPRFMVLAIWPDYRPASGAAAESPSAYTTPYLRLMQEAIVYFGLTETRQDKKECIVDWLMTKDVDGEPISRNLADAMATLIRLPSSQRGGAKRAWGPGLSRAS